MYYKFDKERNEWKYTNLNLWPPSIRRHLKIYLKILLQIVRMSRIQIIDLFNLDIKPTILWPHTLNINNTFPLFQNLEVVSINPNTWLQSWYITDIRLHTGIENRHK